MTIAEDRQPRPEVGPRKRNLIVCTGGSFTTIVAMSLLLPFLPLFVEQLDVTDHSAIVQCVYAATFLDCPALGTAR